MQDSDPWWIFTVASLLWNIKRRYEFSLVELIRVSPRFGVLLAAMMVSVTFILIDILSVTHVIGSGALPDGINPFWKISFIFKCLTDTVILDDFKTALDRLKTHKMSQLGTIGAGAFELRDSDSTPDARAKRTDAPAWSSVSKPAGYQPDIERLDFCTVPDSIYRGGSSSTVGIH